jgi:hypothetical protein
VNKSFNIMVKDLSRMEEDVRVRDIVLRLEEDLKD